MCHIVRRRLGRLKRCHTLKIVRHDPLEDKVGDARKGEFS
jgi:hypothetical protein